MHCHFGKGCIELSVSDLGASENVIEFLKNQEVMTCTFCQGRFITKVKRLAEQYPDEVQIVAENDDGSICAHVPVRYLSLSNRKRELSDEEKEEIRLRLNKSLGRYNTE